MGLKVIGAGVGRTGTFSLKLAIERLDLGPCHHMAAVIHDMPVQVPLWSAALRGHPDWEATYRGFVSAVDWPTAAFFRELAAAQPAAKFVLTWRDPALWADSFGATIYKLLGAMDNAPPAMKDWLEMCQEVIARSGFPKGLDRDGLIRGFLAHGEAVRQAVPADRLLVFQVSQGWQPLCEFLGVPVPDEPFPRTNDRSEFWNRVTAVRE